MDKEFMDSLLALVEKELDNNDLGVDLIALGMRMNRTKLNRKIKDLTGQSTNEFIRSFRLKKSMEIMTKENVTITEVIDADRHTIQLLFYDCFQKRIWPDAFTVPTATKESLTFITSEKSGRSLKRISVPVRNELSPVTVFHTRWGIS